MPESQSAWTLDQFVIVELHLLSFIMWLTKLCYPYNSFCLLNPFIPLAASPINAHPPSLDEYLITSSMEFVSIRDALIFHAYATHFYGFRHGCVIQYVLVGWPKMHSSIWCWKLARTLFILEYFLRRIDGKRLCFGFTQHAYVYNLHSRRRLFIGGPFTIDTMTVGPWPIDVLWIKRTLVQWIQSQKWIDRSTFVCRLSCETKYCTK